MESRVKYKAEELRLELSRKERLNYVDNNRKVIMELENIKRIPYQTLYKKVKQSRALIQQYTYLREKIKISTLSARHIFITEKVKQDIPYSRVIANWKNLPDYVKKEKKEAVKEENERLKALKEQYSAEIINQKKIREEALHQLKIKETLGYEESSTLLNKNQMIENIRESIDDNIWNEASKGLEDEKSD